MSTKLGVTENFVSSLYLLIFSIYTLSDLGDISNLIGSLSRHYSPRFQRIIVKYIFLFVFVQNR